MTGQDPVVIPAEVFANGWLLNPYGDAGVEIRLPARQGAVTFGLYLVIGWLVVLRPSLGAHVGYVWLPRDRVLRQRILTLLPLVSVVLAPVCFVLGVATENLALFGTAFLCVLVTAVTLIARLRFAVTASPVGGMIRLRGIDEVGRRCWHNPDLARRS